MYGDAADFDWVEFNIPSARCICVTSFTRRIGQSDLRLMHHFLSWAKTFGKMMQMTNSPTWLHIHVTEWSQDVTTNEFCRQMKKANPDSIYLNGTRRVCEFHITCHFPSLVSQEGATSSLSYVINMGVSLSTPCWMDDKLYPINNSIMHRWESKSVWKWPYLGLKSSDLASARASYILICIILRRKTELWSDYLRTARDSMYPSHF